MNMLIAIMGNTFVERAIKSCNIYTTQIIKQLLHTPTSKSAQTHQVWILNWAKPEAPIALAHSRNRDCANRRIDKYLY